MDQNREENTENQIDPRWKDQIAKNWGNYCSSCGAFKDGASLKYLRKMGFAHQYVSECTSCGLKTVISLIPNLGMQVTQVRTDISPNEFDKFGTPITSNDYLEFYTKIKDLSSAEDLMRYLNK